MKKLKIILGIFVLLCVLVCTLPITERAVTSFEGTEIFSGSPVKISINMKYSKYLFKKDKLDGTIEINDGVKPLIFNADRRYYAGKTLGNDNRDDVHYFFGFHFNSDMVTSPSGEPEVIGGELVCAYISEEFDKILMVYQTYDGKVKQYIGSSGNESREDLMSYFEGLVRDNDTWASHAEVEDKIFVYENGGFGFDDKFTIKINKDGTFTYSEGMLSSYMSISENCTWTLGGDKLILTEVSENGNERVNYFRVEGDSIVFREESSDNFMYVKLKGGERFNSVECD